ncbi:MAG: hypothetical protein KDD70_16585, partial [Bdellovibrionales bacterium]|nr:hypothetical protein [Bdellovibrionales bacterium]
SDQDSPSRGTIGAWVGKFTTPRGGDAQLRELYAAYSPSCAHNRFSTACTENINEQNIYRSHIILRTLEEGNPQPWHPLTPGAMQTIVDDTNDYFSLLWPTPAIPLHRTNSGPKRFGGENQIEPKSAHEDGLAAAVIGSSSLDHTDIVPPDCRVSGQKFKPSMSVGSMAILSKVRDRNNMNSTCDTAVLPEHVLGIAILQTDNKVDKTRYANNGRHELTRLLGVVDVLNNPSGDTSFAAMIPSKTPFKLEILDSETGYKLTDQLSWHSELDGERRTDCGGCHEHSKPGIPWASKIASTTQYEIPDLRTSTPYVDYDESCSPVMQVSNTPTREQDIWGQTSYLFQGMETYCKDCHRTGGSGEAAFTVTTASQTLTDLRAKNYIFPLGGANSSPAVWAGHGRRLDGRDNNDTFYQPNFVFSSIHGNPNAHPNTARCSKNDITFAQWLYRFGRWIDNHIPNEDSFPQNGASWTNTLSANFDRFHPTVNGALSSGKPACDPAQGLTVDAWDDSDQLSTVAIEFSDNFTEIRTNVSNGTQTFALGHLQNGDDWFKVTATDPSGNRQSYKKTLDQLLFDCQIGQDPLNEQSIRQPGNGTSGGGGESNGGETPTPTPTPNPDPTPDPNNPGSSSLRMSQNLSSGNTGDHIRFTVTSTAQELAGKRFCVAGSLSGALSGATSSGVIALNSDNYTSLSLARYCSTLEQNIEGTLEGYVDFIVPNLKSRKKGKSRQKQFIAHHQAIISEAGVTSSVYELTLKNSKKNSKRARGPLPEAFRKLTKQKLRQQRKLEEISSSTTAESSKRLSDKLKSLNQELRTINKSMREAGRLGRQVLGQAVRNLQ